MTMTPTRADRLEAIKTEQATNAALAELQRREAAEAEAKHAARLQNDYEARRLLAEAHGMLAQAKPLYEQAHAWLLAGGGELEALHRLVVQIAEIEALPARQFTVASRLAQIQPSVLMKEVRAAAGLPESRDWVPEGTPAMCRVFWRALCMQLIGPRGIGGHVNLQGLMEL